MFATLDINSALVGLFIGMCAGFVIGLLVIAATNIGKGEQ